jgi:hypothetical protein
MSLGHCCKRCLSDGRQGESGEFKLFTMLPLSYSTLLCEACRKTWDERKGTILLAALDLFVSETPPNTKKETP